MTSPKRFPHQASYITRANVLVERSVEELERFSGGASVSFYRVASGGYARAAGDMGRPKLVDADMPALVAMRANRSAVRDSFDSGDIALPMVHRAEVTGFL